MNIGQLPVWVSDTAAICGMLVGVAAVVAVLWKIAKPGFHTQVGEVVEKVTAPHFQRIDSAVLHVQSELTAKLDHVNTRLDSHMAIEENERQSMVETLDEIRKRIYEED